MHFNDDSRIFLLLDVSHAILLSCDCVLNKNVNVD